MRFSTIAAVLSAVASVSGAAVYPSGNVTATSHTTQYTTTEIVTQYTTYCPLPTTIVEGNKTYTVTKVCPALCHVE